MAPSPIPKFDNPKLGASPALMLFGAGREKRLYAVPPYTRVESLDFDDHPFEVQRFDLHHNGNNRWCRIVSIRPHTHNAMNIHTDDQQPHLRLTNESPQGEFQLQFRPEKANNPRVPCPFAHQWPEAIHR